MRQSERDMHLAMDAVERDLDVWEAEQWENLRIQRAERQFSLVPDTEASLDAWQAFAKAVDDSRVMPSTARDKVALAIGDTVMKPQPEEDFFQIDPVLSPQPRIA